MHNDTLIGFLEELHSEEYDFKQNRLNIRIRHQYQDKNLIKLSKEKNVSINLSISNAVAEKKIIVSQYMVLLISCI